MFLHGLFFSAVAQLAVAVQASAGVLFVARSGIQFHWDLLSVLPGPEAECILRL